MTDKPTGVFVRLPLSDAEKMALTSGVKMGGDIEAGISAIGTPVTGGELPTEVVRVREHCKDIELPWTYHKVPPSDQDASEYELEFDRLLTHKQALAKLAEKDAEIARLWSALDDIEMGIDALPDELECGDRMTAREMQRQALIIVKEEMKALKGRLS